MFTVQGAHTRAQVMLPDFSHLDNMTYKQILTFVNHPVFQGQKIVIMPDAHAGSGSCIGFTCTYQKGDPIIPNVVGVDIGCGVDVWSLGPDDIDFEALHTFILKHIPHGFARHQDNRILKRNKNLLPRYAGPEFFETLNAVVATTGQDEADVHRSLGSLGGGNHFIEIGIDPGGSKWLLIHSGSRNFGYKVADHWQNVAKTRGHVPRVSGLEWLQDEDALGYFHDMQTAQTYAATNRFLMGLLLTGHLDPENAHKKRKPYLSSVHNYIGPWSDDPQDSTLCIRKGAISAHHGQNLVIPLNMRDGSVIGVGDSNEQWNYSAPHGAGRLLSRSKAKKRLSLERFESTMREAQVWTKCVRTDTLDESPMAYKDPKLITDLLPETLYASWTVRPVFNFKA